MSAVRGATTLLLAFRQFPHVPKTAFSGTRFRDMSTKKPFRVHIPARLRYNLHVHISFLLIVFILLFSFVKSPLRRGGIG